MEQTTEAATQAKAQEDQMLVWNTRGCSNHPQETASSCTQCMCTIMTDPDANASVRSLPLASGSTTTRFSGAWTGVCRMHDL
jgi:hypothetical protein